MIILYENDYSFSSAYFQQPYHIGIQKPRSNWTGVLSLYL